MNTIISGIQTISIINRVGINVIVMTITATTSSIGSLLSHINVISNSGRGPNIELVKNAVNSIDLEFTIEILEELVKEQNYRDDVQVSIKKALDGVNDILVEIDTELKVVKEAIEYHNTKYFNSWRSFDSKYSIETIKKNNNILLKRYEILINLLKIYNRIL